MVRILILFILTITLSCSSSKKYSEIKTELYFGLSNSNGVISDSSWNEFRQNTINKFLNGYTIVKSEGYWTTASGTQLTEESRILIYVHEKSDDINKKMDSIIQLYKLKFDQESVLKTQQKIKIEF